MMTLRSKSLATVLAVAVALPLSLPAASAAAAECQPQIDKTLQSHAIAQDDIKSIVVMRRSRGGMSASNYRIDAWVRLKTCSGYVMVSMTRHCVVQQTYTTGDCKIDGLPSH
jgi:hypothetical protein